MLENVQFNNVDMRVHVVFLLITSSRAVCALGLKF
jgi:hypothetical protein